MPSDTNNSPASLGFSHWQKRARLDIKQQLAGSNVDSKLEHGLDADLEQGRESSFHSDMLDKPSGVFKETTEAVQYQFGDVETKPGHDMVEGDEDQVYDEGENEEEGERGCDGRVNIGAAHGPNQVVLEVQHSSNDEAEDVEPLQVENDEAEARWAQYLAEMEEAEAEWENYVAKMEDQGYDDEDMVDSDDQDFDHDFEDSDDQGYVEAMEDSDGTLEDDWDSDGDDDEEEEEDDDDAGVNYAEFGVLPLYAGANLTCGQSAVLIADLVRQHGMPRRCLASVLRLLNCLLPAGHRLCRTTRQLWKLVADAEKQVD